MWPAATVLGSIGLENGEVGVALKGRVLLTLSTSSMLTSWAGGGGGQWPWRRISTELPGLRKILEREMRFVLKRKLLYEAA